MIHETIKDITWFMMMLLLCIAIFANAHYVLNQMSPEAVAEGEEQPEELEPLWNKAFGNQFIDSFFTQYLVGLGEFNVDPYPDHPAYILNYIYFILATLFT